MVWVYNKIGRNMFTSNLNSIKAHRRRRIPQRDRKGRWR